MSEFVKNKSKDNSHNIRLEPDEWHVVEFRVILFPLIKKTVKSPLIDPC